MIPARSLALIAMLSVLSSGLAGETLTRRIGEKAESLSELEGLYESRKDATERRTILETVIEDATWLEQVGGMKSARSDLLLALARWELLRFDGPPSFGFLCDAEAQSRPSVLVRRPRKDELPATLSRFSERLLFVHIRNESAQPIFLDPPSLELAGGVGEPKISEVHGTTDWPSDLQALAKWGRWPEEIEASGKAVLLIWLAPDQNGALHLNVPVRWQEDEQPRTVRVAFLKELDPEGLARARQEAIRREAQMEKKLEELTRAEEAKKVDRTADKSKDTPTPAEQIPPSLGVVDPAGSGQIIQLRLTSPDTYGPNKKLRVRKNERWVGVVSLNETSERNPSKHVFWATIIEGRREKLFRGTLHEMQ